MLKKADFNKRILSFMMIFTFVLVTKGWDLNTTKELTATIKEAAPTLKGIYYLNRQGINVDAFYSIADTITFYKPILSMPDYKRMIKHELCHRQTYKTLGHVRHLDKTFERCVA